MTSQMTGVLARAALYSFFSGLIAAIIYVIIALLTGGKLNGDTFIGALIAGAIALVIALVFYSSFMLYFSSRRANT